MVARTKKAPTVPVNHELRAALAGLALQGLYANSNLSATIDLPPAEFRATLVRVAVQSADLLIAELTK